jgi:hypothetical protein
MQVLCFYSDEYIPVTALNEKTIQDIYEKEVMEIVHQVMWQLFAMATVMKKPVFSIYPRKGNPNVRMD